MNLTPETIGAGLVGIGGIILALQKMGIITFGKPIERRQCSEQVASICGEHGVMRAEIGNIKSDIAELKDDTKEIRLDIKELLKRNGFKG